MAKGKRASKEAARKAVQADAKRHSRPERERPVIDPKTYMKTCSVGANCGGQPMLAEGNFFKVRAMRDGYASRCKKCWQLHGDQLPADRPAARAPAQQTELSASARRYPYQRGATTHSHTIAEERALVKSAPAGQTLQGYMRVGGMLVPVIAKGETDFLDVEARI